MTLNPISRRRFIASSAAAAGAAAFGYTCRAATPTTSSLHAGDADLTFFGWSDQHVGAKGQADHLLPAIDAMNALPGTPLPPAIGGKVPPPAFVFGCGDITDWPTNAAKNRYHELMTTRLKFPFYDIMGNHDTGGKVRSNWQGSCSFTVVSPTLGTRNASAWFVADLGQVYADLDKIWLWNVRETNALNRGLQDFDIYYSNSPTVAPVTDSAYSFASGGWTLLGSHHLAQGNPSGPAEGVFDLTGIGEARYIGLDLLTNYGSNFRVGLAEMEFTTPEPATLTALLLAAGGMGSYLRRRRRTA